MEERERDGARVEERESSERGWKRGRVQREGGRGGEFRERVEERERDGAMSSEKGWKRGRVQREGG